MDKLTEECQQYQQQPDDENSAVPVTNSSRHFPIRTSCRSVNYCTHSEKEGR